MRLRLSITTRKAVNRKQLPCALSISNVMLYCRILLSVCFIMVLPGCIERQLGTTTPQMETDKQYWVKVLLVEKTNTCKVMTPSSFTVEDTQSHTTQAQFDKFDYPISITISAGKINIAHRSFTGSQLLIITDEPFIFNFNGNDYRGKLSLMVNSDSNSFDAINLVPLEPYLAGVVGAEMPSYWEPQALQAQAIAARTYCLSIKKEFDGKRPWDVKKTQSHQVYAGLKGETTTVWDAVNATKGEVLVCKHPDGKEDIFPTYYSSSCGGHTENSQYVFGDSFAPLSGVACPYCKYAAKSYSFFWPMVTYNQAEVSSRLVKRYSKLKPLEQIIDIIPARQSDYGDFSRYTLFKLIGSTNKTDFLRAEDLRLTIDPTGFQLRSTICTILKTGDKWTFMSGRGWGHGVGMCQCGAQAMARQGKNSNQILNYYYPGSRILKIY